MKALLPLDRGTFERAFSAALLLAEADEGSFHLPDYAARRALGADLLIEVDPRPIADRLKHRAAGSRGMVYLQDRFLGSGDWRSLSRPLSGSATHRDVQEMVLAGFDYRSTEGYKEALARCGSAKPAERNFVALTSPQLVERYFQQVGELSRSIQENGVLRRGVRRQVVAAFRYPRIRPPWVELAESDIGVAIDANGGLLHFGSGKHRIAAAQALGLTRIPVEVRMVHASWVRRQIDASGLAPTDALVQGIRLLDLARQAGG